MPYLTLCKMLPQIFCPYEIKVYLIFLSQKSRQLGMLLLDPFALSTILDVLFTFEFC